MQRIIRRLFAIVLMAALLAACVPQTQPDVGSPTVLATATGEASQTAVPPSATPLPTELPQTETPEADTPTPLPQPTEELIEMTPAPEEKQQIPAGSNPFVTQAMQDLAQRQNISEDQITLLSFESMVWPDGAYGCPSPGMMYTQVLSDGYLIQLQVGKEIFNYHGGGGKGPFLCINGERVD